MDEFRASIEKYFCDYNLCKFYKTKNSKIFPKKHDRYHLSLEASQDIEKIFNNKLREIVKSKKE